MALSKGSEEPGAPASLGRAVGSGVSWFAIATLATRSASFVTQIILGWLLLREDFGVYALAAGLAGFLSIIRDGGVRDLLVQRGSVSGDHDDGALFWIAATFNVVLGAIMVASGPLVAWYYDRPQLAPMLFIMGASVPILTFGSIYYAKLRKQLRFREAAMWATWPPIIRFGSMIILAYSGAGVFSFAWPWLIVAVAESVMGWWYVRERLWTAPPNWSRWPSLLREVRWLLFGRLGEAGLGYGDYLVAGKLITASALGVYFFAFQLVGQTAILLWVNLHTVLLPALTRLADDRERFANALHRAMRVQAMWSSMICFGMASVIGPVEFLLWGGKWADAVPAMLVLACAFPMRVTAGVTTAALQAQGRFKTNGVVLVLEAFGFVVAALLGGLWAAEEGADDRMQALRVATAMTTYVIVARLAICAWVFKVSHLRKRSAAVDLGPAWVCGVAAAVIAILVDKRMLVGGETDPGVVLNAIRVGVSGTLFSLCFLMLTRIVIPAQLAQAVEVLPDRFNARSWAYRLLFLPCPRPLEKPKATI